MAILKSFDPANYETKTITLSVSAGSSYTLGDAYTGGGRVVDIWGAEGFSSSVGAKNVDYVLTGIDSRLSTDYGTTYYTVFKSVTITGTVTIAYRRYGTYVDAGQINQHETRLGAHDARLTSVESVNTTQNNRLSAIETKNGEQDADISALESGLSDETAARQTHESNTTDAHGATSAAMANKGMIRDANARVQIVAGADDLDAVNKAQMDAALAQVQAAAGGGSVNSLSTTNTVDHFITYQNEAGTIIQDSTYAGATGATASTVAIRDSNADLTARKLISTVATGTEPLTVASTTKVTDLNADKVDGLDAATAATASTVAARDGSGNLTVNMLISNVAEGTAPLTVTSTTKVTNLNADMIDGLHAGNAHGNLAVNNYVMCKDLYAEYAENWKGETLAGTLTGAQSFPAFTRNKTFSGAVTTPCVGAITGYTVYKMEWRTATTIVFTTMAGGEVTVTAGDSTARAIALAF